VAISLKSFKVSARAPEIETAAWNGTILLAARDTTSHPLLLEIRWTKINFFTSILDIATSNRQSCKYFSSTI
jgi:hypothetical protein